MKKKKKGVIRSIRSFDDFFDRPSVSRPEGLTFLPEANRFLISGGQSSNQTQFEVLTPSEDVLDSVNLPASIQPINTAFDAQFNRLLGIHPSGNTLIATPTDRNGNLNPNAQTEFDIKSLGIKNARGISVGTDGTLYVLDGAAKAIVRVQPNADGSFDDATVSEIDLPKDVKNPRGIAVDPSTDRIHVLSPSQDILYELSPTGEVLDTRDVSQLGLKDPQSLVFAPTSDSTDSANRMSLFVADSDPNSAGIQELSFSAPLTLAATVNGNFVQTIDTSSYPSPDPAGIAYDSTSDRLVLSDSEINEIPSLFTGDNLFEITRSGSLTNSTGTTAYSNEPTGITFNSASDRFFISDDNADEIFEVNAQYQKLAQFDTRGFGSDDPEGVAYASDLGDLFIADGVDNEIYRVTTSGSLVGRFDTASLGISNPEGIVYDSVSGHLFIVGSPNDVVAEVTVSGTLVDTIDISAANTIELAGLTIAPDPQTPSQRNLYISDRGIDNGDDPNENDGRVHVFALNDPSPGTADLALSNTASTPSPKVGDNVTFTLTINNFGPDDANTIEVTDQLPAGLTLVSATPSQGSYNSSTGVWDVGTVTKNDAATLDIVATPTASGSITYTAEVTASDLPDPDSTPNNGVPSEDDFASSNLIVRKPTQPDTIYASSSTNGSVDGLAFKDEDIFVFDIVTGTWSIHFDGSNVGLGISGSDVGAFHIDTDGSILLSLNDTTTLPGVGNVDEHDIVRFIPTSTGLNNTTGTYELYFDGSDVGLTTSSEDLDAIGFAPDGRLLVSLKGSGVVPGVSSVRDDDLLAFNASSLGQTTSGTFEHYFDGSDVGISQSSEDINGTWIDGNGDIYLTTVGNFDVPGVTGDAADIFTFTPTSTGANTSGTFAPFWDASANGLTGTNLDGLFLA